MGVYEDLMARANKWKQNQNTQAAKPQSGQSGGSTNSVYNDLMARANAVTGKQSQPTEPAYTQLSDEGQTARANTASLEQQYTQLNKQLADIEKGWELGIGLNDADYSNLSKQRSALEKQIADAKKAEPKVQTSAQRKSLLKQLKGANNDTWESTYGTDYIFGKGAPTDKQIAKQLHEEDARLGNAARAYTGEERIDKTVSGALGNSLGSLSNAAGTLADWVHSNWDTEMYEGFKDNPYADYSSLPKGGKPLVSQKDVGFIKKGANALEGGADFLMQQSAEDVATAKEGLGKLGQAGVDLSVNLIQMGVDAAGRAAGLGMLPFFTRAAGGSAYEARQAGADVNQQLEYGTVKGLVEIGTEKLFNGVAGIFGKGAADDIVEATARKLAKTDKGRTVLRAFAGAAGEGTEEVISDLLDPFAKLIYNDQAVKEAWENHKDLASDMLYDYLIGFAMGGLGAGGSIISGQDAAKNRGLRKMDIESAEMAIDQQNALEDIRAQTFDNAAAKKLGYLFGYDTLDELRSTQAQRSTRTIIDALSKGRVSNTTAANIATTPELTRAFEELTGIGLSGTTHDKVITIQKAARWRTQGTSPSKMLADENSRTFSEQFIQEAADKAALDEAWEKSENTSINDYKSYIRGLMRGGASEIDAREILRKPELKALWESVTGPLPRSTGSAINTIVRQSRNARIARAADALLVASEETAPESGTDSTAINTNPEKHTKADQAIIDEYQNTINASPAPQNVNSMDEKTRAVYDRIDAMLGGNNGSQTQQNAAGAQEATEGINTGAESQNAGEGASRLNDGYDALSERYGTIPAGENPFRESAMPQSTTGEDRVSRTARTIYEAEATPDARLGDIRQAVVDGKLSYVPVSNSTLEAEARQSIEYKGWNESLRDWTADVRSGKVNPKLIAMGEALINNAGNSSMSGADYISLVSDFNQLVSGTAQALQAVRIFKTLTPEAKLFALQRSAQSIADKLNEETKKQYNIEISDDLADRFLAQTTDEGRNAVIEEIQQSIADQIPSTWQERWDALRYTNMLGNFKTQIRNVGGNTVMLATRFAKDRVAATLETAASILTGGKFERTKSLIVNPKLMKEAKADFANVVDIAKGEGKYQSVRAQMDKGIQDKRRIFKSGFMEAYRKATNWAMDKGDEVFLGAIYSDAMAGWLQAHGIKSLSEATEEQLDAARTYAIKEAQEATFRDNNSVSNFVSGFDRNWGQHGKAGKVAQKLTQGIVPFRKTPANVAVRAVEYSPLGLAYSVFKAANAKNSGTSGAEVINSFAKGATGTALAAAGYFLARAGLARGVDDDEDESALNKLNGRLDWSIRIGDMDVSLSQLAPMSIPFFMGVRLQELTEDGVNPSDIGNILFATISDPMLEMSMLQGVNDALDGLSRNSNTPGAAIDFAVNALLGYYTQGLSNGLLSQLEQALTENRQTIYTDSDDPYLPANLQYKLGQFTSRFPAHLIPGGHGYHQQDYLDAFGNTQSNGSGAERAFNAFLNPVFTSKIHEDDTAAELGRLMEDNKNVDNFPSVNPERPQRSTTVNGEKLTADEYQQYAKAAGNISQDMIQDFMRSGEYRKLGDEDRAQVVSDIYSYAREQAAKQILNTRGTRDEDITTTWKWGKADNAMNAGLSFGQYEAVKNGRETNTDNSFGIAVNKLDGLSDGDKLKALETFLPADKNGKRSATVRRYEAAMEAGLYFDTWTKVVDAMDKMGNPTSKAQITAVMERVFPGYGDALYAIWNSPDTEMYIEGSPEPKTKEQKQADFLSLLDEVFGTGA